MSIRSLERLKSLKR
ncbi:Molecular chaperone Hsp40/DnaJ family protein [Zea mays]|uniref:Molecular chaperone Hsp40/DnaJ family protein n=1 Tax=Zea mays TaxID=4577 RepID=A0A1D6HNM5_MAIZE|nr:Molecular chaperone Hsp40/DnaJ family protein [Zea mays]